MPRNDHQPDHENLENSLHLPPGTRCNNDAPLPQNLAQNRDSDFPHGNNPGEPPHPCVSGDDRQRDESTQRHHLVGEGISQFPEVCDQVPGPRDLTIQTIRVRRHHENNQCPPACRCRINQKKPKENGNQHQTQPR